MHDPEKTKRKKFREAMVVLFLAFRKPLDSDVTEVYYKFLQKFSLGDVKLAIAGIITSSKHFPSISEILDAMVRDEANEMDIRADILNAVSDYGIYKTPEFKYEMSLAIVEDMGGWMATCKMPGEDLNAMIHFRYGDVLSTWRDSKRKGLPFKLPGEKAIFKHRENGKFKSIGNLISERISSEKSG